MALSLSSARLTGCQTCRGSLSQARRAPVAAAPFVASRCSASLSLAAATARAAVEHRGLVEAGVLRQQRSAAVHSSRQQLSVKCQAAAQTSAAAPKEGGAGSTLYLGLLFAGWYAFNIYFNIYNKQVLKAFPYPLTCTLVQFGVGSLLALTMWTLNLHQRPKLDGELVRNVSPLGLVHTLGNCLTNVSLGRVAVSFTHTIKAMEPFFSVLLSSMFLGEPATLPVVLTLFPIVGGVAMASVSEASFNWYGFLAAMGSNVTFQSRNVLSKKFMGKVKGSLDNINLFSLITIISFFLLLPVVLLTEGVKFTPAAMHAMGIINHRHVMKQALLAALCFHGYQQVSYMILQRVSPVTHSIGNCLKRVIVIVASVIVFQNPMSQQNMIGTGVALGGVFAYSQVKRLSGKKKVA